MKKKRSADERKRKKGEKPERRMKRSIKTKTGGKARAQKASERGKGTNEYTMSYDST